MRLYNFIQFRPAGHREPHNEVGSLTPAEYLVGFEPGAFQFSLQLEYQIFYFLSITMILETIKWHQWFQVISEETIVNKNKLILIKGVYLLDLLKGLSLNTKAITFYWFIYCFICTAEWPLPYNFNKTHNILTHE